MMPWYTIHSPNAWPTALFHLIQTIPPSSEGREGMRFSLHASRRLGPEKAGDLLRDVSLILRVKSRLVGPRSLSQSVMSLLLTFAVYSEAFLLWGRQLLLIRALDSKV